MFTNMSKYQHPIFFAMEDSLFEFILTGSRFFKNAGVGSDWDFFVKDTPELREFLSRNHFHGISDVDYVGDPTFADVFRFDIQSNGFTHIDVQIIHPELFIKKVKAQEFIVRTFRGVFPVPREYAPTVWTMALAAVS